MQHVTRRHSMKLGAGALAAAGLLGERPAFALVPTKDVKAPDIQPEKGASIRVMRPTKFVAGDQLLFEENTKKFTERTGVQVIIEYEAWEDLRPKTAVAANTGSGPDVVLGWLDDPHQFPDKLIDLSDVATYIGEKHGGWWEMPAKYGQLKDGRWIGMPIGSGGGCIVYRKSWLQEAGFQEMPGDLDGLLKVCQGLKRTGHAPGLALGNAVGDGNTWHWVLWSHGGKVVDDDNRVTLDSPETVQALEYAKELYDTFAPGTISWLDPNNNKAYLSGEIGLTQNGISIYYAALNSDDPKMKAIAEDTFHARPPMGPIGRPTETTLIVTAFAFKHAKYPNAAKAYLMHMFETEPYSAWQEACIGYWQPTLKAYDALPFWTSDPKLTPFRDIAKNMLYYGYSGSLGGASSSVLADYVVVQMFAAACSGQMSPKEAAAEGARRAQRYYRT
jgi:multiple sugar transport system substrate-binding protein